MRLLPVSFLATAFIFFLPAGVCAAGHTNVFTNLDEAAVQHFASVGIVEISQEGQPVLAPHITRAEFVVAIVNFAFGENLSLQGCLENLDTDRMPGISYSLLFRDVSIDAPYAMHLCTAIGTGMIWGYEDGNFRPHATINFAEAAKILNIGLQLQYDMPEYQTNTWYATYINSLARYAVFPPSIDGPDHRMSSAELSDLLLQIGSRVAAKNGSEVPVAYSDSNPCTVSSPHTSCRN